MRNHGGCWLLPRSLSRRPASRGRCRRKSPPLERRAADEMAADLNGFTRLTCSCVSAAPDDAENVIFVGTPHLKPGRSKCGEQAGTCCPQNHGTAGARTRRFGGSPPLRTGRLPNWLTSSAFAPCYGDVDPVAPPEFSVEGFDIVLEPLGPILADGLRFAPRAASVEPDRPAHAPPAACTAQIQSAVLSSQAQRRQTQSRPFVRLPSAAIRRDARRLADQNFFRIRISRRSRRTQRGGQAAEKPSGIEAKPRYSA